MNNTPNTPMAAALTKAGLNPHMSRSERVWNLLRDRGPSTIATVTSILGYDASTAVSNLCYNGLVQSRRVPGSQAKTYEAIGKDYQDALTRAGRSSKRASPKPNDHQAAPPTTSDPIVVPTPANTLPPAIRCMTLDQLLDLRRVLNNMFRDCA